MLAPIDGRCTEAAKVRSRMSCGRGHFGKPCFLRCVLFILNLMDGLCRILVVHDRVTSSALGRPCAIQDEE